MLTKKLTRILFLFGLFALVFVFAYQASAANFINISSLITAYKAYLTPRVATKIITPPIIVKTVLTQNGSQGPQGSSGLTGPEGPRGFQGPQGIAGPQGQSGGGSIDTSSFVSQAQFNNQINGILNSINSNVNNLSQSLANSFTTSQLAVSGNATVGGNLNVTGNITGNVIGTINPSFTLGSIPFQGATGLTQDNANLFWDGVNHRLGIGTTTPGRKLVVQTVDGGATGADGLLFLGENSAIKFANAANTIQHLVVGYNNSDVSGFVGPVGTAYVFASSGPIAINTTGSNIFMNTNPGGGNVGIGTTTPGATLDISPTITANADLKGNLHGLVYNGGSSMTNYYGEYIAAPTGTGTITNKYALVTEANAGNVGMGTINPTANLQVAQGTTGLGTVSNTAGAATFTGPGTVSNAAGGTIVTGVGTLFRFYFKVGDAITIGGQSVVISAIISNGSMTTAAITNANTAAAYTYVGTTVTGVGTQFTNTFMSGDNITIGGQTVAVIVIASDTSMITRVITNANTTAAYTLVGGTRFSVFGNGNVSFGKGQWTTNANGDLVSFGSVIDIGGAGDNTIGNYIKFAGAGGMNIDIASRFDGSVFFNNGQSSIQGNNQQVRFYGHTSFPNTAAGTNGYTQIIDNGTTILPSFVVAGTDLIDASNTLLNTVVPLSLQLSGGDVGIGTMTPTAKFQVAEGTTGFGIVSNVAGSTTITGVFTQFLNTSKVGDTITIAGVPFTISTIASATSITVSTPIPDAHLNVPYALQFTTGLGKVTNAANSTSVLGTGTEFLNTFKVGDTITIVGQTLTISAIADNTHLTTSTPVTASHGGTVSYTLVGGIRFSVLGNGNVGIGTASPAGMLDVSGSSAGTDSTVFVGTRAISLINTDTTANNMSGFDFRTNDANGLLTTGAKIMGVYTSHVANAVSGDLSFLTRNAGTITEKMRILANGNVGIGTPGPGNLFQVTGAPAAGTHSAQIDNTSDSTTKNNGLLILAGNNTGVAASEMITFERTDATIIGTISQITASTIAYNTSSDRRIKDNITPTTYGLSDLMKINVEDFTFVNDPNKQKMTGFIAQDLYTIFPGAVTPNGDNGTDPLLSTMTPWMVDYSKLSPLLVKSVQDLNLNLEGIAGTIPPLPGSSSESFATAFFKNVFSKVTTWLADAGNGISNIFATTITVHNANVDNLCVKKSNGTDVCITGDQLDSLLTGVGGSSGSSGGSIPPTCILPQTLVNNVCTDPVVVKPPAPAIPTCVTPQILVNNVCADPVATTPTPVPTPTPPSATPSADASGSVVTPAITPIP